jgi:hypothetical protein
LIDYLNVSPDTSFIFLLHDPDSSLAGGAKSSSQKSSQMRVVMKDFNSQVLKTEVIPKMSASQYDIALRKAIYLTDPDVLLLYAAWITNKEL